MSNVDGDVVRTVELCQLVVVGRERQRPKAMMVDTGIRASEIQFNANPLKTRP